VIEETARHAGDAGILREQIDGATGLRHDTALAAAELVCSPPQAAPDAGGG